MVVRHTQLRRREDNVSQSFEPHMVRPPNTQPQTDYFASYVGQLNRLGLLYMRVKHRSGQFGTIANECLTSET